ncbi:Zinc finger CW-type PWWP domain protein 1 [Fasciola hepatica]|uniref:Zinc finger CW-type PWWP domain protein 1 n=1 Tax=Fasciola hepatica TaxID=6192 RepID=A0A4E0RWB4_FASHE|nr:Zinc finger CW-type PWWP domain protein 1 [Fasciola hepatica]
MRRKALKNSRNSEVEVNNPSDALPGTWVECYRCKKWRYLPTVHDPSQLSSNWHCALQSDDEHREQTGSPSGLTIPYKDPCAVPQGPIPDPIRDEYIYTQFSVGSVVWAKIQGYPEWPAMVYYSANGRYAEYDSVTRQVSHYHVVFLDPTCSTTSRVAVNKVRTFHSMKELQHKRGPKTHFRRILAAAQEAEDALKLPIQTRINVYGYDYEKECSFRSPKPCPVKRSRGRPRHHLQPLENEVSSANLTRTECTQTGVALDEQMEKWPLSSTQKPCSLRRPRGRQRRRMRPLENEVTSTGFAQTGFKQNCVTLGKQISKCPLSSTRWNANGRCHASRDPNTPVPTNGGSSCDAVRILTSSSAVNQAPLQSPISSCPSPLFLQLADDDQYLIAQDLSVRPNADREKSLETTLEPRKLEEPIHTYPQTIGAITDHLQLAFEELKWYALSRSRATMGSDQFSPVVSLNTTGPKWSLSQVPFGSQLIPVRLG